MRWTWVIGTLRTRDERLSRFRMMVFLSFVAAVLIFYNYPHLIFPKALLLSLMAAFFFLVFQHIRVRKVKRQAEVRQQLDLYRKASIKIDWSQLPPPPPAVSTSAQLKELGVSGDRGLLRLLNRTRSDLGWKALNALFVTEPLTWEEIENRQAYVRELMAKKVWRRRALTDFGLQEKQWEFSSFLQWLEEPSSSQGEAWFWLTCLIQVIFLVCLFGSFSLPPGSAVFALILLVLVQIKARELFQTEGIYGRALSIQAALGQLVPIFKTIHHPVVRQSKVLSFNLKECLFNQSLISHLTQMDSVTGALGVRQNFIVHILLHIFVPWDLFWSRKWRRLQATLRSLGPQWLYRLAELEAYLSLAEFAETLRPRCFPLPPSSPSQPLSIKSMVHPLLRPDRRIANDLFLDQDRRCLLLTGSNMSGKSTFLRTVGLNIVLAQTGSPVAAKFFSFQPRQIWTCIGVEDSLSDAASAFYAEAQRLKEIYDSSKKAPIYYLIDEIYRGTNNRERLAGAKAYVKSLAQTEASGLISTHDLELSQLASSVGSICNFHFRESYQERKMIFEYQLTPGVSPTTNALRILEDLGLPTDSDIQS